MDSEQEVETCRETFDFMEQELCSLKAHPEAMEQEWEDKHIELFQALLND